MPDEILRIDAGMCQLANPTEQNLRSRSAAGIAVAAQSQRVIVTFLSV
jgi:hypothetical protein